MRSNTIRPGFTLIEILVVITIIAILAALTLQATSTFLDTQRQANTEDLIRTVSKVLQDQFRHVIEQAEKDSAKVAQNKFVMMMAGNDLKRAVVIWKKFKLKQEFPMTFTEALAPRAMGPLPPFPPPPPFPVVPPALTTTWTWDPPTYPTSVKDLPPKEHFVRALVGPPTSTAEDSAVLLLLALQQNRGGSSLKDDKLPTSAFVNKNFGAVSLKMLADSWGNGLIFMRSDLSATNPAAGGKAQVFADPLDPEGTLLDRSWNNVTKYTTYDGVYWFERDFHPVHIWPTPANPKTYQPVAIYTLPVIASAGKDLKSGLQAEMKAVWPIVNVTGPAPFVVTSPGHGLATGRKINVVGVNGIANANGGFTVTVLTADQFRLNASNGTGAYAGGGTWRLQDENDNIYSWRLRMGATGGN